MRRDNQRIRTADNTPYIRFAAAALLVTAVLLFMFLFYMKNTAVSAKDSLSDVKYKVVEIHSGDSLWSVANDNMNPGFSDIYEYIHEIKKCNNLNTDQITSGCYLMIPYYVYE